MNNTHNSIMPRIKTLMQDKGVRRHGGTGYTFYSSYTDLYDWELYFDSLALIYVGGHEHAIQGLKLFCHYQKPNGFISRRILQHPLPENYPELPNRIYVEEQREHCKPFLFQTALMIGRSLGTFDWLQRTDYYKLKKYLDHWISAWDIDANGLCEWNSAPHSGADTQLDRIGPWRSRFCEGVDLNCFIYRELQAASYVAEAMSDPDGSQYFTNEFHRRGDIIRKHLWNKDDSIFYDRDIRSGKPITIKTAATFLPLWAGIATPEQAQQLVTKHLKNPDEFWRPYPVSSYAHSEPCYTQYFVPQPGLDPLYALGPGHGNWNGGMWPHWNYLIVHGLLDYGFKEEAKILTEKLFEVVNKEEGLFEWYNAETGAGLGMNPFWAGASIIGAILPTELKHGFDPTHPAQLSLSFDLKPLQNDLGIDDHFTATVIH
jgi:hypothetical protein